MAKFEKLGRGDQDMVARAACAIAAANHREVEPTTIGEALVQVLAKHGFNGRPAYSWAGYARACQRNGQATNRQWTGYGRVEQRLASRLAKEVARKIG